MALLAAALLAGVGCRQNTDAGRLEAVWGVRGLMPGEFIKPRAVAIDAADQLYLVDMKAAIQVFSADGEFLRGWNSPTHEIGRPSGLAIDGDGNLLVADSHYHQVLLYDPAGTLLKRIGGHDGAAPLANEFGYISDVAVDSVGDWYIAESQLNERITKVAPEGRLLRRWGGRGPGPGQFQRPRALAFDQRDQLYVADACNHRVQVFDRDGQLLRIIGEGEMSYPFDVAVGPDGSIYVCEWGNCRVQRFSADGVSLGTWGGPGRKPGQMKNPWALAVDRRGRVHVADTENHRVQQVRF